MKINEIVQTKKLDEAVFLAPWILPALATAVRIGVPALKLLLKGGKKAVPVAGNTAKTLVKKSTVSGVITGATGMYVYDKVTDAYDWLKDTFGLDMDEDTLNIFAQIIVKYGIPLGAVAAVLYGGKRLKNYMKDNPEDGEGNTTINNYYYGDEPATEGLKEFTISDLKYMGITHITPEQKKELQRISHENDGNITRSDLKKVGLLLQTRHVREEECPACGGTGWDRSVTPDEDDRGCDECGGTGEIEDLDALKNEDAMSAEEIGKYPDLAWTNVNDTQEVKTYLNNMSHKNRVKIEAFRQRVTEPQFQTFLKKYMTDHPDKPYDSVDSKPVTTNAPVKGHHNEDAVSDQVKGSDPMPKAKPGRTDHPYRGKLVGSKYNAVKEKQEKKEDVLKAFDPKTARALMMLKAKYPQADNILSALLADVENNEKDSDVTDLSQDYKMEKLSKAVDVLQKEINLLKGDKKLNTFSKFQKESVNEYGFADVRQKRIAIDTVKNPNKALLGGPSASEAEDILKTKFGYSDNQIAKLKGDDEPQFMASKEQGKLAQAWSNGANNIKSGDIELIRGEDGAHIIQKNSWEIGDFSLDTDSDLWVVNIDGEEGQGTYGSIDDIVKSLDSITEEWYKPWTWGKKPTAKDLPGDGMIKDAGKGLEKHNKELKNALDAILKNESVIKEETGISKFNKEDPNNPEVYIDGYGSLMLNQIEDDLVRNFTSLTDMAKKKDWDGIEYQLNQTGVLQAKIEAILNTKEQLQAIRRKGGPKSRGINKESLYDALMGEGVLDPFKVIKHKRAYERAADTLHTMLQRKYKENEGNWRHGFGWYVAKIADGFNHVDSDVLNKYYLDHYKSAFITETGGVGRVVQGVNTSVDVGPNEIKKQAAKFGNVVNKDGLPKKTFR